MPQASRERDDRTAEEPKQIFFTEAELERTGKQVQDSTAGTDRGQGSQGDCYLKGKRPPAQIAQLYTPCFTLPVFLSHLVNPIRDPAEASRIDTDKSGRASKKKNGRQRRLN